MNQIRHYIRKILSEAHYTTWNSLKESSPIDGFNGGQSEIVKKLAKQLGIDKIAPLGSGTQGYAYYIPNNRVLKITKDKSEVAEAFKIKGKKLKHLANVYDAFTLGGKYKGVYVVILELLNKSEVIDNADQLLDKFLDSEFGYGISFFFEDYSNGSINKEEIKEYEKNIKDFYKQSPESVSQAIWYMKEKFGIIDDIRKNGIKSTDWGLTNLGLKKDGHIAMYDFGYGDPNIPNEVQNIDLRQEVLNISTNDYPDFFDSQYNQKFANTPYTPVANINDKYLMEDMLEERRRIDDKTVSYILNKINIPDAQYFKSGGYGDAFISNEKIVKFTTDFKEAKFAQKFAKYQFKHIANIDNVIKYKEKNGTFIYVIILEKLKQISEDAKNIFRAYEKANGAYIHFIKEQKSAITFEQFIKNIRDERFTDYVDPWVLNGIVKYSPQVIDMNIQMTELKQEVSNIVSSEEVDSYLSDFHFGNMGTKPNGKIAFFDLRWMTDEKHPEGVETIKEIVVSNEELNKKELPHKFPELFKYFVKEKTDTEIKEIAPSIDFSQDPAYLIRNLEINYPSLFDSFADWLFENFKNNPSWP